MQNWKLFLVLQIQAPKTLWTQYHIFTFLDVSNSVLIVATCSIPGALPGR